MPGAITITIASDMDHDALIAEIYCNGAFVALVSQEAGPDNLMIECVNRSIGFDWLIQALNAAKAELTGKTA